jgi:protein-disulfide isomerase
MISRKAPGPAITMQPLDESVDHVRGSSAARLVVEYGDYECPHSRRAFRAIERVEKALGDGIRFAFRQFPLTEIHPHALAAAAAAEAAALQHRFWGMHELLFHHQTSLEEEDLRRYAGQLALDSSAFENDRTGASVSDRIRRDVQGGLATGQIQGTPTLFIDGVVYRGGYEVDPVGAVGQLNAICSHLDSIELTELPQPIAGCEDCLAIGGSWVHLRMCQSCGQVGCCDSSRHQHASAHAARAGHPIARSAEPGEDWSWCYLDNVEFVVGGR